MYSDLLKAGILNDGDYYYGYNDLSYRWVAYNNWTYVTTFSGNIYILLCYLLSSYHRQIFTVKKYTYVYIFILIYIGLKFNRKNLAISIIKSTNLGQILNKMKRLHLTQYACILLQFKILYKLNLMKTIPIILK